MIFNRIGTFRDQSTDAESICAALSRFDPAAPALSDTVKSVNKLFKEERDLYKSKALPFGTPATLGWINFGTSYPNGR